MNWDDYTLLENLLQRGAQPPGPQLLDRTLQASVSVLGGRNWPVVMGTLDLVKDTYLFVAPFDPASRNTLENSAAYDAVLDLVFAEPLAIREAAVYTLGKCSSPKALPTLCRAVDVRHHTDPLLLPRLLGEIRWLERDPATDLLSACVQRILDSPAFLSRWSLLDDGQGFQADTATLTRLANDPFPLVAAEAQHRLQGEVVHQQTFSLANGERRRLRKQHAQRQPLTFAGISTQFRSSGGNTWANYSAEELTDFVENIAPYGAVR